MQDHTRPQLTVDNRFSMVPHWVILSNVSDGAVRLYAVLMKYADGSTLQAFPSRRRLANDMRKSVKSVDRHLKELVGIGAVKVERRKRSESQENLTSLYTVVTANPNVASRVSPPGGMNDAENYTHLSIPTFPSSIATTSLQESGDAIEKKEGTEKSGTSLAEQLGTTKDSAKYLIDKTVHVHEGTYNWEELEVDIYKITEIDVGDALFNRRWNERLAEIIDRSPSCRYGAAAWLAQITNWTQTNN